MYLGRTGRVAAGAIAEKYLKLAYGVEIVAFVSSVGAIHMPQGSEDGGNDEDWSSFLKTITREKVDQNAIRCPDEGTEKLMTEVSGGFFLCFWCLWWY